MSTIVLTIKSYGTKLRRLNVIWMDQLGGNYRPYEMHLYIVREVFPPVYPIDCTAEQQSPLTKAALKFL